MVRGKSRRGYISRTIPDRDRLKRKVDQIAEEIKNIPECYSREQLIGEINRINSKVRGIIQYNQCCTWVSVAMDNLLLLLFLKIILRSSIISHIPVAVFTEKWN